jgi:hypothetical protein
LGAWRPAAACGAFFLAQPLLIAAERRLRVRRWPTAAGRAWTLGALAVTSPLVVEPVLRMAERVWGAPGDVMVPAAAALGFCMLVSVITGLAALALLKGGPGQAEAADLRTH